MARIKNARLAEGEVLVSVTVIAAELSEVMKIAKEISIGAKNAKAIAARAGDKARGFQPITNFIDDMARHTLKMVRQIDEEALNISRISSQEIRTNDARRRMHDVVRRVEHPSILSSFVNVVADVDARLLELNQQFDKRLDHLSELLGNINSDMRAATAISSSCRVEASRAEEFREGLSVVADNLEKAVEVIKKHVKECSSRLQHAQQLKRAINKKIKGSQ